MRRSISLRTDFFSDSEEDYKKALRVLLPIIVPSPVNPREEFQIVHIDTAGLYGYWRSHEIEEIEESTFVRCTELACATHRYIGNESVMNSPSTIHFKMEAVLDERGNVKEWTEESYDKLAELLWNRICEVEIKPHPTWHREDDRRYWDGDMLYVPAWGFAYRDHNNGSIYFYKGFTGLGK